MKLIQFSTPYLTGTELENISESFASGSLAGDGPFTAKCSQWIEENLGTQRSLLTSSCTSALEMAAILCDISPGDEIIMPSYTFVSTANAFALRGGVPVFVDIRPDTLNIDEQLIEAAITDRTKVIVPVHYAGVPCEMDEIMSIASKHSLMVVEDAAQAIMSSYKGRKLGTIGDFGCLSFHGTKNIHCGEGGALLINNSRFIERAEVIREKGTNRSSFLRGQVDKYTWRDIGSSFLPSDVTASILFAQLGKANEINSRRKKICKTYFDGLSHLSKSGEVDIMSLEQVTKSNGHMFYMLLPDHIAREKFVSHMLHRSIRVATHYEPLHSSPEGQKIGRIASSMRITDSQSQRIVRLPLYPGVEAHQKQIIEAIQDFFDVKAQA